MHMTYGEVQDAIEEAVQVERTAQPGLTYPEYLTRALSKNPILYVEADAFHLAATQVPRVLVEQSTEPKTMIEARQRGPVENAIRHEAMILREKRPELTESEALTLYLSEHAEAYHKYNVEVAQRWR